MVHLFSGYNKKWQITIHYTLLVKMSLHLMIEYVFDDEIKNKTLKTEPEEIFEIYNGLIVLSNNNDQSPQWFLIFFYLLIFEKSKLPAYTILHELWRKKKTVPAVTQYKM